MDILSEIIENQNKKTIKIKMLDEMASVAFQSNKKQKFCIYVNPDQHRKGNEYFKVYDRESYSKSKRVCRISFNKPKYIIHTNKDGKENFKLDAKLKESVIAKLKETYDVKIDDKEITVWQWAILQYNKERGLIYAETLKNFKYRIDPKTKTEIEIPRDQWNHPNYLPIDLKMPDYSELPTE